jgi:hypothetical protein
MAPDEATAEQMVMVELGMHGTDNLQATEGYSTCHREYGVDDVEEVRAGGGKQQIMEEPQH